MRDLAMPRVIKRYDNRKLYDTDASAYVSLSDIADLVRQGETVQIVDNTSGDDLTAQVLMQIMLEEGKRGQSLLPTDLLHDLVRRSSHAIDTGVEQIRHSVDDFVQGSISRLGKLLPNTQSAELGQLRDQLAHLEDLMTRILKEADDEASDRPSRNPSS